RRRRPRSRGHRDQRQPLPGERLQPAGPGPARPRKLEQPELRLEAAALPAGLGARERLHLPRRRSERDGAGDEDHGKDPLVKTMKTLISIAVLLAPLAARAEEPAFAIGAKVGVLLPGISTELGATVAGGLEVQWGFPVLERRIGIYLEANYT